MPVYQYRAKNIWGEEIAGTCEAEDKASVVIMLRDKKFYPLEVKEVKRAALAAGIRRLFTRVTPKDLAVFCRQFSTMVNAGVPILTCLDILRKQTQNPRLRSVLNKVYEEVQKGKNLSEIMAVFRGIFPELLVNMIEAGEVSGTLDRVMDRMASHYEKEYRIDQKVKNALVYPSLVAVVAVLVVIFLVTVVLPTFISMFQQVGAVLPASTRVLMAVSSFIRNNYVYLCLTALLLVLMYRVYIRTERGRELVDKIKLRLPLLGGVNRKIATAQFARTLGALTASGIPLLQSIDITKKVVGNTVIQKRLDDLKDDVKRGKGLSDPLRLIEAFPPMLVHMVKIGEDTGTLDYILDKTADFFDDEVETAVTRMTTLLEPAIIVMMAVVVAFIVVSIVVPMFDMMTQINF